MDEEFYVKDGVSFERVTRILDYFSPPELVDWKVRCGAKEANRISKMATKIGSRVHELIELGEIPKKSDAEEVKNCMRAWDSWISDFKSENIKNGETLYCDKRMIAGTPDFTIGSELIDIKTSREVKPSHFVQLGAYASLMPETPLRISILRLDKQLGIYEYVGSHKVGMTVDQCITAFNYLLGYYRFYRNVQSTIKPRAAMPQGEIE